MRHSVIIPALLAIAWARASALQQSASMLRQPVPMLQQRTSTVQHERGGYVVERDGEVQAVERGPHNGGGQTLGYSFFKNVPHLRLVFRKRALKPGAGIGYHEQKEDEIYYVLSGTGVMTIDGKTFDVGPGTAVLTRSGSSHGLKQAGPEDLVILVNYEQAGN